MDQADLRILQALQQNARVPNTDLARAAELAPSTTLERVRRLEERGIIKRYRAHLDGASLGYGVQAMVMISLGRHQANPIESFEEAVRAVPEVRACFHVTGRYDYLVHVVVRDIEHLRELVTKRLAAIRGVEKEETFLVLSETKTDEGYPIELIAPDAGERNASSPARPAARNGASRKEES